jgi:hypothetical protein
LSSTTPHMLARQCAEDCGDLPAGTVQAGLNAYAALASGKGSLTCKDTLLVGWGGATDNPQDNTSCSVAGAYEESTRLELEGCTLQLHPDSTHSLNTSLLHAHGHAQVQAVNCKLVGAAPGNCEVKQYGVMAQGSATVNLVSHTCGCLLACFGYEICRACVSPSATGTKPSDEVQSKCVARSPVVCRSSARSSSCANQAPQLWELLSA